MNDSGDSHRRSEAGEAESGLLEMERRPGPGRRFRLRGPHAPGEGQPLWVRFGLRSRLPVSVALSVVAALCAMVGAAALVALTFFPGTIR